MSRPNEFKLGGLIAKMVEAGVVELHTVVTPKGWFSLSEWCDDKGIDLEAPIPSWNEDAEAWEI